MVLLPVCSCLIIGTLLFSFHHPKLISVKSGQSNAVIVITVDKSLPDTCMIRRADEIFHACNLLM